VEKELQTILASLLSAGAGIWVLVLVIFGLALIWRGPEYVKVIATYRNEKRRINGDLSRKRDKLRLGVEQKRAKLETVKNSRRFLVRRAGQKP